MSDASMFTLCPQSNQSPDPAAILGLKAIDFSAVLQLKQQQWLAGTREWLFDQMDEWLADPDGARTLWLVGRGGTGKTMALTEWLERKVQQKCVAAWHFFRHDEVSQSSPPMLLSSLSAMLCQHVPGPVRRRQGGL